jgi:hypothetical protein
MSPANGTVHLVFLVHGIRDRAAWRAHVAPAIEQPGVEVCPCSYGYFDLFRFWWPWNTRLVPLALVERQIRGYKARAESKGNHVVMSVIAHSFGTYLISKIMEEATDLSWERIIFCGCIVPESFRWDKVAPRVNPDNVINDVGNHDIWPVMAKLLTFGYGDAGTHGFGTAVHDRFHDSGHSDYFNGTFPATFWAPWIHDGKLVKPATPPEPTKIRGWLGIRTLNVICFGLVALVLLALLSQVVLQPLALMFRWWWVVYSFAALLAAAAWLPPLRLKLWHQVVVTALIAGAVFGLHCWLGPSAYHVSPAVLSQVTASADWDDAGDLSLALAKVPDDATLAPNRLRIDVVQGQFEKEVKSPDAAPPGTQEITTVIKGATKKAPAQVRLRVLDPHGVQIHETVIPIQIQGAN